MRIARLTRRLSGPDARLGALALADQAVFSGTGFAVAFLLAVFCAKAEYGAYVIPFYALTLSSAVLSSFVLRPMVVLGAPEPLAAFRRYATALLIVQAGLGLALALALGLVVVVLSMAAVESRVVATFGALAGAIVFVLGREFVRQVLFTRLRPGAVLLNDSLHGAALIAAVLWLRTQGWLEAPIIFRTMALVAGGALGLGVIQVRAYLTRRPQSLGETIRRNWAFGKWSVANALSSAGMGQAFMFIVAAFAGPVAVASLEVSRLLVAPLNVVRTAVTNVAVPRASRLFSREGRGGMHPFIRRATAVLTAIFLVYCAVLLVSPGTLLHLVYGDKYPGTELTVRLWAVVFLGMALRTLPGIGLSAMRRPDLLFKTSVLAAVATLGAAWVLVPAVGVTGGMMAAILGELLCLGAAMYVYHRPGVDRKPVVEFGT